MTSKIEKLVASLEKSDAKVEKIERTIERHFKRLEKLIAIVEKVGYKIDYSDVDFNTKRFADFNKQVEHIENLGWANGERSDYIVELYDIVSKLKDIREAHKKLKEAREINKNWEEKLMAEQAKENFINNDVPQVIKDFVDAWGEMAFEWHMQNSNFPDAGRIKHFIEHEKRIKIIQLTMRVTAVTGTITDAKGLSFGEKGDLTGFIIGEKGRARVETISAGGWNIQCFHYRTLVQEV